MKLPTTLAFPALTMSLLFAASTALAQEVAFAEIDGKVDGVPDGYLDRAELELEFGPEGAASLLAKDADLDGRLSPEEVTADEEPTNEPTEEPVEEPVDGELVDDGDGNHGHGNSPNGFDTDNPGRGHGDGVRGGGNGNSNRDGNKHSSDD